MRDGRQNATGLKKYIISQFGNPRGLAGSLVGKIMASENRRRIEWVVESLPVRTGMHILEIGYGPGIGLELVAKKHPDCKLYGLEQSEVMIRQCRRRNRDLIESGQLEIVQTSGTEFPFNSKLFDLVFGVNILHHIKDISAFYSEIHRVLKPDGIISLTDEPHFGADNSSFPSTLSQGSKRLADLGRNDTRTLEEHIDNHTVYSIQVR